MYVAGKEENRKSDFIIIMPGNRGEYVRVKKVVQEVPYNCPL